MILLLFNDHPSDDLYINCLQSANGMPLFLTSVLTMGSAHNSAFGGSINSRHQSIAAMMSEKQVEDQKRRRGKRKRNKRSKVLLCAELRNVVLQEIPPYNAKAVADRMGPAAAVTHNVTNPCHLELFEENPWIGRGHLALYRSSSIS